MSPLEKRMVLHRFMCNQFGYSNLRAMLSDLDNLSDQIDGNESGLFAQALLLRFKSNALVTKKDIARYDENIATHSQVLRMTVEKGKSWKPFQYLALLFTERYLDLYFEDADALAEALNAWKETDIASNLPGYKIDDVRTLAFQSATGSGKTLLLHVNILQYQHYMKAHGRLHKLNKIILVTPDEGLSRQHLRELQESNIPAQLFSDDAGAGVFAQGGAVVDIIDLHKLDEKKGIKRVALGSFEENNLVMVDEGHLGTSGTVWRKRRKQLARNGFTFEYSATFNQAVSGGGEEIKKLRDEYGKSILFDYSYKFFYEDGYGKDYQISNLQQTDDKEANNIYLLACLLTFYQQRRIYADKGGQWRDFNLAPPLWVFLGKTVTGGRARVEVESDVVRVVNFLAWVLANPEKVSGQIKQITTGNAGLVDDGGNDIFDGAFSYIKAKPPKVIYDDMCQMVYCGKGELHISHLTGTDEIQISAGDSTPFGVINVGDASGLYTKLEAVPDSLFSLSKNAFSRPLFADVDNDQSPINIVIGARKFVAGWNSWRVSTMGLMHVGTGEGPQIIQMFGRGVRLKGHGMSLKRHTALEDANPPPDSDQLKLLETLNIFGLKANYMDQFKRYLEKEGIDVDRVTLLFPTRWQFNKGTGLKILRKEESAGEFQYSGMRIDLPANPASQDTVFLDRNKYLQFLGSDTDQTATQTLVNEDRKLEKQHLDLINKQSVYHKVLERKRQSSWHNMTISQGAVDQLLANPNWYTLHIPSEKLELSSYARVCEWESLAADLICLYASQYWHKERSIWEHKYIEAVPLKKADLNYVAEYRLAVNAKEESLVQDITALAENVKQDKYDELFKSADVTLSLLKTKFHAYRPLLHARSHSDVQITPTPLNDEEAKFVEYLKAIVENKNTDFLQDKEIYLMRNLSRGKGVSFFDDYGFYPDFILWIKNAKRQDILFIDPKGLMQYNSKIKSKVDLHQRIKDTESKIQNKHPDLFLHSYIWSVTRPQDIGSDEEMTRGEWQKKGVFFAQGKDSEVIALLQHALCT